MRQKRQMQQRKEANSQVVRKLYILKQRRYPIDDPFLWLHPLYVELHIHVFLVKDKVSS